MAAEAARWRFTVDDYHRMVEAGILTEDDRVELIDGEIIKMSPIGALHASCVRRVEALLHQQVGDRAVISVQNPVQLGAYGEPEPDVAVLRPRADFYAERHPQPADILLLIEVADSSLAKDRSAKLPLYAREGIAEAWLVDLEGEALERHTSPAEGGYRLVLRARRGETVASTVLPELAFAVDAVLG
jgi:Uma2 family endonuclease